MYHVRKTKTASGAMAVQIVRYQYRNKIIVKHIGSAHTKEDLIFLTKIADDWIEKENPQLPLPLPKIQKQTFIPIDKCQYLGFQYSFFYEVISDIFRLFRLDGLDLLLRDLALIRILEPASKLASITLLTELFGKTHKRASLYRAIPAFIQEKKTIEQKMIMIARNHQSLPQPLAC